VSRTIGDREAKVAKYGGNPKVVIPDPDIVHIKASSDHDFIILASDGIFDKISSEEVVQCIWRCVEEQRQPDIHRQIGVCIEGLIKESFMKKTFDNVSCVIIAFSNLKNFLFQNI